MLGLLRHFIDEGGWYGRKLWRFIVALDYTIFGVQTQTSVLSGRCRSNQKKPIQMLHRQELIVFLVYHYEIGPGKSSIYLVPILHEFGKDKKINSCTVVESASGRASGGPTDFIRASCRVTRYPALCVQSLSVYATTIRRSQRLLAMTALAVSLTRARSASVFAAKLIRVRGIKPKEYAAVKDCMENIGDTIDRLSDAVHELGHMGRAVDQEFIWHMNNVETWVSAALTDETTCVDEFAGRAMDGNIKLAVRRRINNVAQVTSNALALVNRYAERRG